MRLLLDSHVLIWYDQQVRLSSQASSQIRGASHVNVSAATVWELTIKQGRDKTLMPAPVIETTHQHGFTLLDITAEHAKLAGELPLHHRDPFDRMLVAQATLENLTLVTHDRTLLQYEVPVMLV